MCTLSLYLLLLLLSVSGIVSAADSHGVHLHLQHQLQRQYQVHLPFKRNLSNSLNLLWSSTLNCLVMQIWRQGAIEDKRH